MFRHIDFGVLSAYLLIIGSVILCVVYGAVNWKKGGNVTREEATEESRWEKKEKEISDDIGG
jgi:hypothetical protein